MLENHFPAHQQALIKNNICTHVLAFENHDLEIMNTIFQNYDYDFIIDLCEFNKQASVGAFFDGSNFIVQPYPSWTFGEDLKYHPPIPKPGDNFWWNEEQQAWVEITSIDNDTV